MLTQLSSKFQDISPSSLHQLIFCDSNLEALKEMEVVRNYSAAILKLAVGAFSLNAEAHHDIDAHNLSYCAKSFILSIISSAQHVEVKTKGESLHNAIGRIDQTTTRARSIYSQIMQGIS